MGCRWCVHWCPQMPAYEAKTGECRRFPNPVETTAAYRCGEFLCEPDRYTDSDGSNLMQGFFERMHEFREDWQKERAKRLELEKKLRALRAKGKKTPNDRNHRPPAGGPVD